MSLQPSRKEFRVQTRDYRDVIGGVILVLIGLGFAAYAFQNYRLGGISRMGPGMFPLALGLILALLGAVLTGQALRRPGDWPVADPATAGLVLAGIVAFGLAIRPLGLIPAICLLVVITTLAEWRIRPVSTLALCAVLSVMAWLIFGLGLGLPVRMFWWNA